VLADPDIDYRISTIKLAGSFFFIIINFLFFLDATMDGLELARWTRFAAKGGIGICTAVQDCVAETEEDLMFLKVSIMD
jgi:hypothetical protein